MPLNLLKKYNDLLEINHLSERERIESLRRIFDRDITENDKFNFRTKTIRPLKVDGLPNMEVLFSHLINASDEQIDEITGKIIKTRNVFDYKRSERLHWIKHHIEEKDAHKIDVFSYTDRIKVEI